MKKPTFIIGKKQIILSALTLMLAVAVYINYVMSQNDSAKQVQDTASQVYDEADKSENKTYGDTQFVNNTDSNAQADANADANAQADVNADANAQANVNGAEVSADDYFAQARIDKMTNRDTAVQTLQSIMGGGDVTEDEMVTSALDAIELSSLIEKEGNIETLIKAQGFEDCIAYLDSQSAKIVVKTAGLDAAQAAAIKDIILGEVSIPTENIRIFEVK